ncbi:5'-deoxynucleotidase [Methyloprofundus sedimenti]|uniref:5'-deoxynucleotidase n=1 Tax=Methyloprofundus sedimenti TaxID=1420851 RepID=A0A1V8M2D8_9GAMM|nr:5'-deoxynucleotidase [Methyloprofundus sedimenti]OQK15727.1 5'-deoxynucleotidase [Methyloprofundus sedimenti]
MKSHFFAYISKIRWLQRWGLKRNAVAENVMEHSWEVSVISHALALIKNRYFDGNLDVNAIVVAALYHDCSEVLTGDMPSPIKYHSLEITRAYKTIEKKAEYELLNLLPEGLKDDYRTSMIEEELPKDHKIIIKAADTISAYLKCKMEVAAGNQEFSIAEKDIEAKLKAIALPEVKYFLDTFSSSYELTLDELFK